VSRLMIERPHRGYIASRPIQGSRVGQHIQNLVIRDYAIRTGLTYVLSATEYSMPGCYMMLEQLIQDLERLGGIIAYSLFMLPQRPERRLALYEQILNAGASIHTAVEGLVLERRSDIGRIEDILLLETATRRESVPDLRSHEGP